MGRRFLRHMRSHLSADAPADRRWGSPDLAGDAGATRAEVQIITAVLIVSFVGAGLLMLGVFSDEQLKSRQSDSIQGVTHATGVVQRTLTFATVPKGYRSAVWKAGNDHISFFASLDRDGLNRDMPTLVSYRFNSERSCLEETTIAGQTINTLPAWPQNTATSRCIVALESAPKFSYFHTVPATEGAHAVPKVELPAGGVVMNPLTGTSICPVSHPTDLGCIVSVDFDATVASEVGSGDRSTDMHLRVSMPNVVNAIANQ